MNEIESRIIFSAKNVKQTLEESLIEQSNLDEKSLRIAVISLRGSADTLGDLKENENVHSLGELERIASDQLLKIEVPPSFDHLAALLSSWNLFYKNEYIDVFENNRELNIFRAQDHFYTMDGEAGGMYSANNRDVHNSSSGLPIDLSSTEDLAILSNATRDRVVSLFSLPDILVLSIGNLKVDPTELKKLILLLKNTIYFINERRSLFSLNESRCYFCC